MFKLPYSLIPTPSLMTVSSKFLGAGEFLQHLFPFLKVHLKQAKIDITLKHYLSMCFVSDCVFFIFFGIMTSTILLAASLTKALFSGLIVTALITLFIFFQQIAYPNIIASRRIKDIERNLLAVLQNIYVQLNSGVPLFNILVNITEGDYGEISKEFSQAIKEINAGRPQVETLEEMAAINPSLFFRRAIWQIVNGMKSGSNMSHVINEIINLLSEEQLLQIQRYGAQLNPLAMFYMMIVVIAPSLGMTLLIVLSSFISLSESMVKIIFWGMYGMVVFFQIIFMGAIKSRRPNLLGA
ncbi:MAG: type II secretion system F family protein [Nanoarchaeota archaeon]